MAITITAESFLGPTYVFTVTDHIPKNFSVWPVNTDWLPDGYVPLCELSESQPFEGAQQINTNTLKLIRTDGVKEIMRAAVRGYGTLEKAKKLLSRIQDGKKRKVRCDTVLIVKAALPFMEALKWD